MSTQRCTQARALKIKKASPYLYHTPAREHQKLFVETFFPTLKNKHLVYGHQNTSWKTNVGYV